MESPRGNLVSKGPLRAAGALVGPFIFFSLYLLFSRWPTRWSTGVSDYAAMILAVGVALLFIASLPVRRELRIVVGVALAPLLWVGLAHFAFNFVGVVFGDWL